MRLVGRLLLVLVVFVVVMAAAGRVTAGSSHVATHDRYVVETGDEKVER
jgi:hypothetical protein